MLADEGASERLYLPNPRFHRHVGEYAGHNFDIEGNLISREEFERRKDEWLPTMEDREYVRSLMHPVTSRARSPTGSRRRRRGSKASRLSLNT